MKVLYYDTFSGISGDMHLGAMVDLGVDPVCLIEELKKLGLSEEYEIKVKSDARKGITGTKVDVILLNQQEHTHHQGEHRHHSHEEHQNGHREHIHEEHQRAEREHIHEAKNNHGAEFWQVREERHEHSGEKYNQDEHISDDGGHDHHHEWNHNHEKGDIHTHKCNDGEEELHNQPHNHYDEESHTHAYNHNCGEGDIHAQNHHHEHHNGNVDERSHIHDHSYEHEHSHNHNHEHEQVHGHEHTHGDEDIHRHEEVHGEGHSHEHGHSHHHDHRNLRVIENLINKSKLSDNVKNLSIEIFKQVAEAEAKVHGKSLYEVHFHEVGATDSIVDIVGAAICLDYLKVDRVLASPVEVGGGFVKCAHGRMPVPAPATSEILKGVPITTGAVPFETTTPTGAAILKVAVHKFTKDIDFIIDKVAYGVGNRDTEIPNVLRVYLGHYDINKETAASLDAEEAKELIIECNLDDMNSEAYEYIFEKLFKIGAKDVYITPIIMKKGRPAQKLTVLCSYKIQREVEDTLLRETTTFGVRKYEVEKVMLNRDFIKVNTKFGEVTVKRGFYNGEVIKFKGEYQCCKELALKNNVTLEEVYNEVTKAMMKEDV
ncbi:MAG: nickel pincer cofactor biosynthesis protein LarC [Clostridium sp.]